ncbi:MAG TPA: sialidase family protein [Woeseiaceae bacterium]|nr:sialidase family protein [Woeseiaceae bacterium]
MKDRIHVAVIAGLIALAAAPGRADAPARPGIVLEEFVYTTGPAASVHASTIVELATGELVAAFFGGPAEGDPDVEIWLARKPPDGAWSAPVSVADGRLAGGERVPAWNPVLFEKPGGELLLFYKLGPSPGEWWGMVKSSRDGGRTWSAGRRLGEGLIGPVKNKPVRLESEGQGAIVAGSSTEHDGWRVHVERSTDGGATWRRIGPLETVGEIGAIQPALMTFGNGRLGMLCRTQSENGFMAESWSDDGGRTWSPLAPGVLPNNNSGFDVATLGDGRHLIVYNHSTREQAGMGHKGRGILNVATSDDGRQWNAALVLEHLDAPNRQFSYPAVIQGRDGLVHVVYTWHRERIKHVVLDPGSLPEIPMPDGDWPSEGPASLSAYEELP